jgi:hypothetical protein
MSTLRQFAPAVRKELERLKNVPPVSDSGRKRRQDDIAGNVEEQPSRQLSIAEQCLMITQQKMESSTSASDEESGAATDAAATDAADAGQGERIQVSWEQRYSELVSDTNSC